MNDTEDLRAGRHTHTMVGREPANHTSDGCISMYHWQAQYGFQTFQTETETGCWLVSIQRHGTGDVSAVVVTHAVLRAVLLMTGLSDRSIAHACDCCPHS